MFMAHVTGADQTLVGWNNWMIWTTMIAAHPLQGVSTNVLKEDAATGI